MGAGTLYGKIKKSREMRKYRAITHRIKDLKIMRMLDGWDTDFDL